MNKCEQLTNGRCGECIIRKMAVEEVVKTLVEDRKSIIAEINYAMCPPETEIEIPVNLK